ncbi:MAG: hypothetical protein N2653_07985 [Burkholderiales bacterium]|nr:hypothetical protein [Burkholderiales bacterium]
MSRLLERLKAAEREREARLRRDAETRGSATHGPAAPRVPDRAAPEPAHSQSADPQASGEAARKVHRRLLRAAFLAQALPRPARGAIALAAAFGLGVGLGTLVGAGDRGPAGATEARQPREPLALKLDSDFEAFARRVHAAGR